jgi:vacuolar protein-sorting-associated protein 4
VLILGATNLPYSLDSAIRRRFQKRIYIPLPDGNARTEIFRINLKKVQHTLEKDDFVYLGKETEGYSGSDIFNVVRNALMEPIRTCGLSTHFKKVSGKDWKNPDIFHDDLLTPCAPSDEDAIEMVFYN